MVMTHFVDTGAPANGRRRGHVTLPSHVSRGTPRAPVPPRFCRRHPFLRLDSSGAVSRPLRCPTWAARALSRLMCVGRMRVMPALQRVGVDGLSWLAPPPRPTASFQIESRGQCVAVGALRGSDRLPALWCLRGDQFLCVRAPSGAPHADGPHAHSIAVGRRPVYVARRRRAMPACRRVLACSVA